MTGDVQTFEKHRRELLALAYRMLGDLGRAEDAVQEAWLRWQGLEEDVDAPRAYLAKVVTRLCLNELQSGRARREESRSDRLPEPVHLDEGGVGRALAEPVHEADVDLHPGGQRGLDGGQLVAQCLRKESLRRGEQKNSMGSI